MSVSTLVRNIQRKFKHTIQIKTLLNWFPGKVKGVRGEGNECAKAEDAVRMGPKEVRLAWIQVGCLDQLGREVVGKVPVDEAAPQISVTEMMHSEVHAICSMTHLVG